MIDSDRFTTLFMQYVVGYSIIAGFVAVSFGIMEGLHYFLASG